MSSTNRKRILLFSTLNPYPFWAGSEKLWFDAVCDERFRRAFEFRIFLADSPETRKKGEVLAQNGAKCSFYDHFNVGFLKRNLYRLRDSILSSGPRTFPWYRHIHKEKPDLVWFNVAALADIADLEYAAGLCKQVGVPYVLLLQHGYEEFFLNSGRELEAVRDITMSAKRFIFIAEGNRRSLERAIGARLENAYHTQNALPPEVFMKAEAIARNRPPGTENAARFFNLGRFSPRDKAQHLILESLSGGHWKDRDWKMSFIGISGFDKEYLLNMAEYYSIAADRIMILPFTKEILNAIGEQDVLLMPSLAEGTPFSMIESMACGRPAVGTPVGGIPELIRDGETGWLSRTTAAEDVAEAMERMWSDREDWAKIGENARKMVELQFNQANSFPGLLDELRKDAEA